MQVHSFDFEAKQVIVDHHQTINVDFAAWRKYGPESPGIFSACIRSIEITAATGPNQAPGAQTVHTLWRSPVGLAGVNQQPPMHQLRMRPSKLFWGWTGNTSSPAQSFWFFQPLLCPKVFPSYLPPFHLPPPPTSLPPITPLVPTSPHLALNPSSELKSAWNESHHR